MWGMVRCLVVLGMMIAPDDGSDQIEQLCVV
jgi:hypothetical protein